MKKEELPQIALLPLDNSELKPLGTDMPICSNIEEFKVYNDPVFNLKLGTKFRFSIPNNFSGYVKFEVNETYGVENITTTLTFNELYVKS